MRRGACGGRCTGGILRGSRRELQEGGSCSVPVSPQLHQHALNHVRVEASAFARPPHTEPVQELGEGLLLLLLWVVRSWPYGAAVEAASGRGPARKGSASRGVARWSRAGTCRILRVTSERHGSPELALPARIRPDPWPPFRCGVGSAGRTRLLVLVLIISLALDRKPRVSAQVVLGSPLAFAATHPLPGSGRRSRPGPLSPLRDAPPTRIRIPAFDSTHASAPPSSPLEPF